MGKGEFRDQRGQYVAHTTCTYVREEIKSIRS